MPFTAKEKQECAERELRMRKRVYHDRVANGRMSKELACREIRLMEEIAADYGKLAEGERLI